MRIIICEVSSEIGELTAKQFMLFFPDAEIIACDDDPEKCKGINWLNVADTKDVNFAEADLVIVEKSGFKDRFKTLVNDYKVDPGKMAYVDTMWPEKPIMRPSYIWERLSIHWIEKESNKKDKIISWLKNRGGLLDSIGIEYGTDKASVVIQEDGFRLAHNYLYHYERELVPVKDKAVRICELGCGEGASLKMWKKFFENGEIWGVDLNPHVKSFEEDRIHVLLGNSAEKTTAEELSHTGKFDIIVDDASHAWGDIRTSFEMLWDTITPGGLYIVEDITCGSKGAFPSYPPTVYDAQSISDYFKDRTSILEYALDWAPDYNRYHFECLPEHIKTIEMSIDEVKYVNGAIMVRKRG